MIVKKKTKTKSRPKKKMKAKVVPSDCPPINRRRLVSLRKKHGKSNIHLLTSKYPSNVYVIPTGIRQLDKATTVGGYPAGLVMLYGWESHGKTTIALMGLAEAQKLGPCAFVDAEFSLVPSWAESHGVDLKSLTHFEPDLADEAFDYIEAMFHSGYKMIVLDSVNSLEFDFERKSEIAKQTNPRRFLVMGKAWRKLSKLAIRKNAVLLVVSQMRHKVAMDGAPAPGPKTTTGGGAGLKFYSRMNIKIHRATGSKQRTEGGLVGEQTVFFSIDKNKVGEPFQTGETVISFDGTIRHSVEDYLTIAMDLNRIKQKSHQVFVVVRTGEVLRGRKQFKEWLDDSPKEKRTLTKYLGGS